MHFGLEEAAAGSVVADTLGLRDKIKDKFSDETRKFPDKLVVQIKDTENKLHPLKNDAEELELDGVLKPDGNGEYRVHVEPSLRCGNSFYEES